MVRGEGLCFLLSQFFLLQPSSLLPGLSRMVDLPHSRCHRYSVMASQIYCQMPYYTVTLLSSCLACYCF